MCPISLDRIILLSYLANIRILLLGPMVHSKHKRVRTKASIDHRYHFRIQKFTQISLQIHRLYHEDVDKIASMSCFLEALDILQPGMLRGELSL